MKVHDELKGVGAQQKLIVDAFPTGSSKKLCCSSIQNEQLKDEIVKFICMTGSPWRIVDKKAFLRLLRYCAQADIEIPGSDAIREAAKKIYDEMKVKLRLKFLNVCAVSLTVHAWTTENDVAFLGVTVHWIDDDWSLHERVVLIGECVGKLSGESIADILMATLEDFGLQSKVQCIFSEYTLPPSVNYSRRPPSPSMQVCAVTTDNAPDDKKMMAVFAENFKNVNPQLIEETHVPCLAYAINLVAKEGLKKLCILPPPLKPIKEEEIEAGETQESSHPQIDATFTVLGKAVARIRDIINAVRESKQQFEKYQDLCNIYKLSDSTKLPLDCRSRWNSTYAMLLAAYSKREALDKMAMCFLNTPIKTYGISAEEWDTVKVLIELLEPLRDATNFVGKSKMTTTAMAVFVVNGLLQHLDNTIGMFQKSLKPAGSEERTSIYLTCIEMKSKLTEYRDAVRRSRAFAVATLLDPSSKLRDLDPRCHEEILSYIRSLLVDVGNNGEDANEITSKSAAGGSSSTGLSSTNYFSRLLASRHPPRDQRPQKLPCEELDRYLTAPCSVDNEEPSAWWRREGRWAYPKLANIAKRFLTVCATSIQTERFFSSHHVVQTYKGSRYSTENIEMLMTLKCWMREEEAASDEDDESTVDGVR